MKTLPDGTIKFTDSPEGEDYVLFNVNGPPPKKSAVSSKNFPLLNVWDDYLLESSVTHGVPFALLKAICVAESGMNPGVVSKAGAIGLMQLMPKTAQYLKVDPWDPQQNVDGGANYIRKQIDRFQNYELALAAYNAGPGNVKKYNGIPPFKETQVYVRRVMDIYQHFLTQNGTVSQ
ncbi:MAG: lytic transglycosylase domain-containing protein [Myxococcota bacterium]|nr:lytic transglycosylase domain-containing protein [Myxococcota bacterium]